MNRKTREWTCLVMEALDSGLLDAREVTDMCLSYMSEADVEDMCRANDLKNYLRPNDDENEE